VKIKEERGDDSQWPLVAMEGYSVHRSIYAWCGGLMQSYLGTGVASAELAYRIEKSGGVIDVTTAESPILYGTRCDVDRELQRAMIFTGVRRFFMEKMDPEVFLTYQKELLSTFRSDHFLVRFSRTILFAVVAPAIRWIHYLIEDWKVCHYFGFSYGRLSRKANGFVSSIANAYLVKPWRRFVAWPWGGRVVQLWRQSIIRPWRRLAAPISSAQSQNGRLRGLFNHCIRIGIYRPLEKFRCLLLQFKSAAKILGCWFRRKCHPLGRAYGMLLDQWKKYYSKPQQSANSGGGGGGSE
jgi:hypothetical protein